VDPEVEDLIELEKNRQWKVFISPENSLLLVVASIISTRNFIPF
jgi:hypothetical protein